MLNFMICSLRGRECPYEFDFFIAAMIITPNCVFSFSSEYSNKGIISEWLVINPAIRLPVHPDDAPLFFLIWDPKQAFLFDGHFIRDCVAKDWQAKLPSCPFCPHMNPSFDCQLHYSENLNSFQSNRVKLSLSPDMSKNPSLHLCRFPSLFFYPQFRRCMDFRFYVCYTDINDDRGGVMPWQKAK